MGYFSNGAQAEWFKGTYCTSCINLDKSGNCPIMDVHFLYGYDNVGKKNDAENILNMLITKSLKCKMFIKKEKK